MIDIDNIKSMVDQRRVDPKFCPIIENSTNKAIYFMVAGNILAKEIANTQEKLSANIEIPISMGHVFLSNSIPENEPTRQQTLSTAHKKHDIMFRAAISRCKKKLREAGQVLTEFKAYYQNSAFVVYESNAEYTIMVETYTYSFNPIVAQGMSDLLNISNEFNL